MRSARGSLRSCAPRSGDALAFRAAMDALAALLAEFPEVAAAAHFVLVPGPGDPGAAPVLPRPALPAALCGALLRRADMRVTLASNPCRLRFFTQEVLVFRGDVTTRLTRASALAPLVCAGDGAAAAAAATAAAAGTRLARAKPATLAQHVAETIVAQGHLLPLPLRSQPVYWEFDHALRASPTPDAIIIGEDQRFWSVEANGALVFCPGSFAADETFAVYRPGVRVVEESSLHAEEEGEEEGEGGREGDGQGDEEAGDAGGGGDERGAAPADARDADDS
jgi:DNA polymerase epsilon subunit 2